MGANSRAEPAPAGVSLRKEITMTQMAATRDAYGTTLVELGEQNPAVVVLDADLSGSTKTALFAKKFPERFFNMGIAEANMVGTAAGLAAAGKIPFVSTFAIFAAGRAWEQIRQSVAYPKANVKIVPTHGGITVGEDGGIPPVGGGYRHHAGHPQHDGHRTCRRRGDRGRRPGRGRLPAGRSTSGWGGTRSPPSSTTPTGSRSARERSSLTGPT